MRKSLKERREGGVTMGRGDFLWIVDKKEEHLIQLKRSEHSEEPGPRTNNKSWRRRGSKAPSGQEGYSRPIYRCKKRA